MLTGRMWSKSHIRNARAKDREEMESTSRRSQDIPAQNSERQSRTGCAQAKRRSERRVAPAALPSGAPEDADGSPQGPPAAGAEPSRSQATDLAIRMHQQLLGHLLQ